MSVGKIVRKVAPKSPASKTLIKYCRCGHSRYVHEHVPGVREQNLPSATMCLMCDCQDYRFASKRVS